MSGHTLDCLRRANSSDISQGLRTYLATLSQLFSLSFDPTLDGPNGLIPDYPSKLFAKGQFACVPFIAGTNLDEGEEIVLFLLRLELYLILSAPQELFSPGESIQRKKFTSSSSGASLRRSLRLRRPLLMWQQTSCVSIRMFLP